MTPEYRRNNAVTKEKRLSTRTQVIICVVLFVVMAVLVAPFIAQAMATMASTDAAAPSEYAETGMSIPFLKELATAAGYAYEGSRTVSGMQGVYSTEYACAVQGDNFVVKTEVNQHEYRQLYTDGNYTLVDDTLKIVQPGVCKYDYIDEKLISAINGRLIRIADDIIDGVQATRVEVYYDGTVYAYYLNQQGVLIRFYYLYDGNEVTLNLSQITPGNTGGISFDIPSGYSFR